MNNLRLGLEIDAIDRSPGVFGAMGRNAEKAVKSVAGAMDKMT